MRQIYSPLDGFRSPFGRLMGSTAPFTPAVLFGASEPGVWYDPSDVANLAWRRNLLTFTEQFDNAAWTKRSSTATAGVITATAGAGDHDVTQSVSSVTGNITFSVKAKAGTSSFVWVCLSPVFGLSNYATAVADLTTGAITKTQANGTVSITGSSVSPVDSNGFYRIAFSVSSGGSNITAIVGIANSATPTIGAGYGDVAFTAAGTETVQVKEAQLELGSVATDYQRISDVNTEVIERFPSATLYQDTAGTTPVTTPGQTVALALDKSKGLVLGSEQIVNGSFSADTDWLKVNGATISGGVANLFNATTIPAVRQTRNFALGRTYLVSLTWTGTLTAGIGAFGSGDIRFLTNSTLGSWTGYVTLSAGTGVDFWVQAPINVATTVDNISVKELPGFHATQATLASRPTYGIVPLGGRRNLLTRTEEFSNADWASSTINAFGSGSVANTTATTDPLGGSTAEYLQENTASSGHGVSQAVTIASGTVYTLTAYFKTAQRSWAVLRVAGTPNINAFFNLSNGTVGTVSSGLTAPTPVSVGNGWYRCSITWTSTITGSQVWFAGMASADNTLSYTGNGTSGIYLWGAQLETGSSATAYQRVGSAFDVTEAGVASLSYLSFDGVDDFLITPTITPGIDRAQVFAGVRKLSDANTAIIAELSAIEATSNGSFNLYVPGSNAPEYSIAVRGSSRNIASFATYTSPTSTVISAALTTAAANVAAAISARFNGVANAGTSVLSSASTGNFLAYPLYIGRRGGTTLPFSGNIFSLIVRFGTNLDAGTITSTETWVNGKTGAYT